MRNLLLYLDARFGEASTYGGMAALLAAAHVSVDPGVLHAVTLWGTLIAAVLAVLISDTGNKPVQAVATEALATLVAALKAMPAAATAPVPSQTGAAGAVPAASGSVG